MSKTKSTISISLERSQIQHIESLARQERMRTGENVTRSQVVRRIVDAALRQETLPSSQPGSGSVGEALNVERSDAINVTAEAWREA